MSTVTSDRPFDPLLTLVQRQTAIARQSLKTALARNQRLLQRLESDLRQTDAADTLRLHGELLKTSLASVPRGATTVVLQPAWLEDGEPVAISLRPELSAQENLQRMFARARGLERGRAVIARREEETLALLLQHEALRDAGQQLLRRAEKHDAALRERTSGASVILPERAGAILRDVERWLAEVAACRLRVQRDAIRSAERQKLERKRALPKGVVWFQSSSGLDLLAGKNAEANDVLVTRLLRGRDWWLHVRDQAGAHVVVRSKGSAPVPEADLREAAVLCAHLSGIDAGNPIEVSVAPGTSVRKVKGSAAGLVYVSGERALRVRVDAEVVRALYAAPAAAAGLVGQAHLKLVYSSAHARLPTRVTPNTLRT